MTLRDAAQRQSAAMLDRLAELVSCESPTGSAPHLSACADLVAGWGSAVLGRAPTRIVRAGLPHLLWSVPDQRVLLVGHLDTVWPAQTLRSWPFTVTGDVATGPGVCDMKAGVVQLLTALGLLADPSRVGVLLTGDEETGSATSRDLVEREARRSGAVLVCEPSTPDGALKVARKGGSAYRLGIRGRAGHASEPHLGVNATVELAHQVLTVTALSSTSDGTTVTPTVVHSGTTSNTVPEAASLAVDVRAWTRSELDRVDAALRGLAPRLPGTALHVDGGVNRHPLPPEVSAGLLETARLAAADIGLPAPDGAHAAGASDANFAGALGVPTLDGLGAVGGRAHARGEYVRVSRMPDRAALLAALLRRLVA